MLALPPAQAPAPWSHCVVSVDAAGSAALTLLSTCTVHMLMSADAAPTTTCVLLGGGADVRPAPNTPPQRVLWDFQRGFVGLLFSEGVVLAEGGPSGGPLEGPLEGPLGGAGPVLTLWDLHTGAIGFSLLFPLVVGNVQVWGGSMWIPR